LVQNNTRPTTRISRPTPPKFFASSAWHICTISDCSKHCASKRFSYSTAILRLLSCGGAISRGVGVEVVIRHGKVSIKNWETVFLSLILGNKESCDFCFFPKHYDSVDFLRLVLKFWPSISNCDLEDLVRISRLPGSYVTSPRYDTCPLQMR